MIVSWKWLKEYVSLEMSVEELTDRLTLSGLNLEGIEDVAGDLAIDLEVTSNRPDCLGHIGVAREVGVLFGSELTRPTVSPTESATKTADVTSVAIECEDLCPRYIARVVRGAKVGPSPDWLVQRLTTLGIRTINNVVDITNYVLMECGQPLHAFDLDKLQDRRIVVRRPKPGEKITAIDQGEYELKSEMCVIADGSRAVAIGGVMGGLETEIGDRTTNILIEVADFQPLSIRNTARALNLHSDSSYRFERGVDPGGMEWASRRCAQLILELAGGELLEGAVDAGPGREANRAPILLRYSQLSRILGIDVPADEVLRILKELGLEQDGDASAESCSMIPASWRRDLTREVDLIEEVARIHGYEQIPEDVLVPLQASARTVRDRVVGRVHEVLNANGFFEAITMTFVDDETFEMYRPPGGREALKVEHSSRRRENVLRQSLIPSLLHVRRENEKRGNADARLYEIASTFLAADPGNLEAEPTMLSLVSGQSFFELKGVVAALADRINPAATVAVKSADLPLFTGGRGCEVLLDGKSWGWLGEVSAEIRERLDLHDDVSAVELDLSLLEAAADLSPQHRPTAQFPASTRDMNFLLGESVTWQELADVVEEAAGPLLERLTFVDQYRGKQIPADKKSYLLNAAYRSPERTLTADEIDVSQQTVIAACREKLGAELR